MKLFVISLERAKERRKFISAQLKLHHVNYEIVDAIDSFNISNEEIIRLRDPMSAVDSAYLNKPMYACALSHIKVYKKIVEENLDCALIVEDDALLPQNLSLVLDAVKEEVFDDDIICLSYYSHSKRITSLSNIEKKVLANGMVLAYPTDINDLGSAMAYIVSFSAAARMVNSLTHITCTADNWGNLYDKGAFDRLRCLYPNQFRAATFESTLEYSGNKDMKTRLATLIRKYKIPFLYNYIVRKDLNRQDRKCISMLTDCQPYFY